LQKKNEEREMENEKIGKWKTRNGTNKQIMGKIAMGENCFERANGKREMWEKQIMGKIAMGKDLENCFP